MPTRLKLNDGNEVRPQLVLLGLRLRNVPQIPTIAFGTGSVWKHHDVTEYVEQALESGFDHIDTAACV
jgi:diketogulonate reductase-like aldo/keto reductase